MTVSWSATLAVSLALIAACGGGEPEGNALQRVQRKGVARLGFANEAPFAYRDAKSGELTGEAPAVARRVLAALGVRKVEGVLTEFGALIPGLKAGRFDLIAAGMYVTPERCKQVRFSQPSYCVQEALVVARGNPLALHSYGDVVAKAAALGVVAGTVEVGYARGAGLPDARLSIFPDAPSALEGLQSGRVHAFAATSLTAGDLLRKSASTALELAEPFEAPSVDGKPALGCGAFAFRKGDDALRDAFDRELAALLAAPGHRELVAPFGFTAATAVRATREQLCGSGR
jgi:polar amino acid transport system substrate-binding protein